MNINPDPLFFWAFLGCVIFLLLFYKIILDIVQAHRRKPPIETEFEKFATKGELGELKTTTKTDLGKLETEVRSLRTEMRDNYDRINTNDEARSGKIHDRIDDVFGAVRELKGAVQNIPCLRSVKTVCPE